LRVPKPTGIDGRPFHWPSQGRSTVRLASRRLTPEPRFQLADEFPEIDAQTRADVAELNEVEAPLPSFEVADEGLTAPERFGQLGLRHRSRFPALAK